MPKNKYIYKKLIVKVNGIVIPMDEYIIEDNQITFKEAPEANIGRGDPAGAAGVRAARRGRELRESRGALRQRANREVHDHHRRCECGRPGHASPGAARVGCDINWHSC